MNKTNEELACLRVACTLVLAVDVSIVGWMAQNYDKADWVLITVAGLIAVALSGLAAWAAGAIMRRLKDMEN